MAFDVHSLGGKLIDNQNLAKALAESGGGSSSLPEITQDDIGSVLGVVAGYYNSGEAFVPSQTITYTFSEDSYGNSDFVPLTGVTDTPFEGMVAFLEVDGQAHEVVYSEGAFVFDTDEYSLGVAENPETYELITAIINAAPDTVSVTHTIAVYYANESEAKWDKIASSDSSLPSTETASDGDCLRLYYSYDTGELYPQWSPLQADYTIITDGAGGVPIGRKGKIVGSIGFLEVSSTITRLQNNASRLYMSPMNRVVVPLYATGGGIDDGQQLGYIMMDDRSATVVAFDNSTVSEGVYGSAVFYSY